MAIDWKDKIKIFLIIVVFVAGIIFSSELIIKLFL